MAKKQILMFVGIGSCLVSAFAAGMPEGMEEFSIIAAHNAQEPVVESAVLSDEQKRTIQTTLNKIFTDQITTSVVYSQLIKALMDALHSPEVVAQGKRFVAGLADLVKTFFKNITISPDQAVRLRDFLLAAQGLAQAHMHDIPEGDGEDAARHIVLAQEQLSQQALPISVALQGALSQDMFTMYKKTVLEMLLRLIGDALSSLPASARTAPAQKSVLSEPLIPEHMQILDQE